MAQPAVHFDKLDLHHVRGIDRGQGFAIEGLEPGFNLIYGPNGSGKTTTALALQELLWPQETDLGRAWLRGDLSIGEDRWQVTINYDQVECARNGHAADPPNTGPAENRDRYRLALHELVQQEDDQFAHQIIAASQGGYDLDAACDALGFRDRPPARHRESKAVAAAHQAVVRAREHQQQIERAEAQLGDLRRQHEQAVAAASATARIEQAIKYHQEVATRREVKTRLDALPPALGRVTGREREALEQLDQEAAQRRQQRDRQRHRRDEARDRVAELALPEEGVPLETMQRLNAAADELKQLDQEATQQKQRLADAETEVAQAQGRLAEHLSQQQLEAIDRVEVEELTDLARESERLEAQRQVLEARRQWLENARPQTDKEPESHVLRSGIEELSNWLASPVSGGIDPEEEGFKGRPWSLWAAAAILVVLALLLAFLYHLAWLALLVAGPLLLLIPTRSAGTTADTRPSYRDRYRRTGLPEPQWSVQGVGEHLLALARQLLERQLAERAEQHLEALKPDLERFEKRREAFEAKRLSLAEHFGIPLDTVNDEWLVTLAGSIARWQKQRDEAAGARARLGEIDKQAAALRESINDALAPFGLGPVDSGRMAAEAIESLSQRQKAFEQAQREASEAERALTEDIEPQLQELAERRSALFTELDLEDGDEAGLDQLLARREQWRQLQDELTRIEARIRSIEDALADHAGLLEKEPAELEADLGTQRRLADQRDELTRRITQIEHDVEVARSGHALADALREHDAAIEALERRREEDCRAAVGHVLGTWVRRISTERARPQVFRDAGRLLAEITQGAVSLELDDEAGSPGFRARFADGAVRPVTALSTGERVQLLLAVRIAFMERDEPARLPLIMDETLGTADDRRAGAIIDAVSTLAQHGRQVFYFTAQHDEVGKWKARLQEQGVPLKLVDLADLRRLSSAEQTPLEIASVPQATVPAPGRMSYEQYGKKLNVPGLDPAMQEVGEVHLWHVLDDAKLLHRLLSKGIERWGQLRTLAAHGGEALLDDEPEALEHARARARAIDAAFHAWRIGRGKPIDRAVLVEADAVTDRFIDLVSALSEKLGHDAAKLIATLEDPEAQKQEVPFWRKDNTQRLREYFEEHGYLSADSPLTRDELRVRILAAVAADLSAGRLTQAWLDRLIASLPE